ncbi:hypothetical protein IFR04_006137 [Cadophora malorum]|uniref:Uncharacterized protein n=1 Tax=Cadophora malorum TaxID=108018 RepID=A0A8H7TJW0_9HELO|nr:hypothetical protein IFR04_006137 [Cadophora malorum]
MDSTLPQMESFDFDRLDPVALEQTLAWFKEHPELPAWEAYEGVGPGMYTKMLEGDGVIDDWAMGGAMEDGLQDLAESRSYTGPWHDCTICAPQAQAHDGEFPTAQDGEGM